RLLWMLERHQIAPGDLELEITESAMFRNRANSLKLLHELHEAGLSIVLDDFGTGYSSLSLVQDLPLTKLKIDRSFVCQLDRPGPGESIISATLSLCRELGITSCAEGVETKTQLKRLRELGCDFAQGYYIGRPTSALQHAAHNELDDSPADWRTKAG
ncbi:MAG: EAL domain-containing protein, partial [Pseudomonadota bacterium]